MVRKLTIALGVLLIVIAAPGQRLVQAQVAVIGHKDLMITTIDKDLLLELYQGEVRNWSDSTPVVLYDLPRSSPLRKEFFGFLGKRISRMQTIWLRNMLSGDADPPRTGEHDRDVREKVARTPGSIGFIGLQEVNSTVVVLLVIGEGAS